MRPSSRWTRWAVMWAVLSLAAPARAAWHSLETLPVESPVYRLLDDLASQYPLARGLLLTRPWTREDLGRFLDQLAADVPAAATDPAYVRLRRELEPGDGGGREPMIAAEDQDVSLELSSYLTAGFAQDEARHRVTRDFRAGVQSSLAFGDGALLFVDGYLGTVTPGPHGTPNASGSFLDASTRVTAWVDRATLTWARRGFRVHAGRDWLRWGPGERGSLALSDASPAFDMAEARVRIVGGAELSWFVAALDPAAEQYLAGHRLEMRAGPSVELGLSELGRFDGTGNAALHLLPLFPYALDSRRTPAAGNSPKRTTNAMFSGDFTWTWRPGIRLYGELMVDDATLHNTRPLAGGYQLGLHLRRGGEGHATSLRVEYSRLTAYTYADAGGKAFAHVGFPTGFALGPDVDQLGARFELRPAPALALGLEGVVSRKGANAFGQAWHTGDPVPARQVLTFFVERDSRYAATLDWSPSPSQSLSLRGGIADLGNVAHVPGAEDDGAFGSARATLRW